MAQLLVLKDARLLFKNFTGKKGKFTPEGTRTFSILLDEDLALRLQDDGWNVKPLPKRDDDDDQTYHLPVLISYRKYSPHVFIISGGRKVEFDEKKLEHLDWMNMEKVDLSIWPSKWNYNGDEGVKAYMHEIYVTRREDELERMYAHIPNADSTTSLVFESGELVYDVEYDSSSI